ncbi:MAG: hypothetical protein HZA52_19660 [Planctomycetes bacterium]|nr:hypothetical protein [Planctomycetota bacterium]
MQTSPSRSAARVSLFWPILALALVAGIFLRDGFVPGKVLLPLDTLYEFEPWRSSSAAPITPANPILLDQAIVIAPWLHFAAERLRAGELPLWNSRNYAGQPIGGAYQLGLWWPPNWIYFATESPWFFVGVAWLKLVLAGSFTLLLLRRLGLSLGAASTGALAFMLCGFQVVWLGHNQTNVALFAPLLLWCVERCLERPSARNTALFALAFGLQFCAGHAQTSAHLALVVAAYALLRGGGRAPASPSASIASVGDGSDATASARSPSAELGALGAEHPHGGERPERRTRALESASPAPASTAALADLPGEIERSRRSRLRLGRLGLLSLLIGGLLGATLAAPQLLPFIEYLRDSQGLVANASAELVARDGAWKGLAMLATPRIFGAPQTHDYHGPLGAHLNYSELVGGYVGAVMLAFALVGVLIGKGRARWFFVGLLAFATCAAYQLPPIYDALRAVPLLSASKLMRFSLFVALALAVLGAFGLQVVLERLSGARRTAATVGVFALVALELCAFGRGYNPAVDASLAAPRTPLSDFLLEKQRTEPPFRILAVDGHPLIANANLFYGLPLLTGYDSLELARMTELVSELSSDPRGAVLAQEIRWFDRPLPLGDLLGVRYLLTNGELGDPFRLVFDGACKVYENPHALPPVFFAEQVELVEDPSERVARLTSPDFDPHTALVERAPPEELPQFVQLFEDVLIQEDALDLRAYNVRSLAFDATVTSKRLVVVPAAWAPGWRATANGIPIPVERVDHALRGVWLDWGQWHVELRYEPASTRIGLWIGGASLVMLLALLVRRDPRA